MSYKSGLVEHLITMEIEFTFHLKHHPQSTFLFYNAQGDLEEISQGYIKGNNYFATAITGVCLEEEQDEKELFSQKKEEFLPKLAASMEKTESTDLEDEIDKSK